MILLKTFIQPRQFTFIEFLPDNKFDITHHEGYCQELNFNNCFLLTILEKDNEIMRYDEYYIEKLSVMFNRELECS